jgi:uracil-DNA glycosylase family 4
MCKVALEIWPPMDDRLRQELAAWLEFYRELGIEDFYRRAPGGAPGSVGVRAATTPAPLTATKTATPTPTAHALLPTPPLAQPTVLPPPSGQALSLFEAPPPLRRGPESLEEIRADLGDCQRCKLAKGRKHIVFGEGNPRAAVVFIGEGPGADEDEQGRPFVGRAGQLLNRTLQAVGLKREDVYICNVVKCRPPGNRTPDKDEVEACSPFLFRQLEAIKPRLVCCLGAPAMRTVLGLKEGITKVRGRFLNYGETKAIVAFHPAYILRNPREEKILREDFEKIRDFLAGRR